MTETVLLFPGQGSQKVGMGAALAREIEAARRGFAQADDALGDRASERWWGGAGGRGRLRGSVMQEAVPPGVGAMAALLGLDAAAVAEVCAAAGHGKDGQVVSAANLNGAGQIVIAGHARAGGRALGVR